MYLPCDFQRDSNLGYAFINLIDSDPRLHSGSHLLEHQGSLEAEEAVDAFWVAFDGFATWAIPSAKALSLRQSL